MTWSERAWPMSSREAARIRQTEARKVLKDGLGSVNRLVETRDFGPVLDRRTQKQIFSVRPGVAGVLPTPHFEHDILQMLNDAQISFVQKIYSADDAGISTSG